MSGETIEVMKVTKLRRFPRQHPSLQFDWFLNHLLALDTFWEYILFHCMNVNEYENIICIQ